MEINIFSLSALGVICAALCVLIKKINPEISLLLAVGCSAVFLIYTVLNGTRIVEDLREMAASAALPDISFLLKGIGIILIAQTSADICADYSQAAIGNKIMFAARLAVLVIAMPYFKLLLEIATGLMS